MKIDGAWQRLCLIVAANHTEAWGEAMLLLSPALYDKPARLGAVTAPAAPAFR